jgi:hypothetical protein
VKQINEFTRAFDKLWRDWLDKVEEYRKAHPNMHKESKKALHRHIYTSADRAMNYANNLCDLDDEGSNLENDLDVYLQAPPKEK